MSDLKKVLLKNYRERYRTYLETRDMKYLNQDGLSEKEVEPIKEEVYKEYCKDIRSKKAR